MTNVFSQVTFAISAAAVSAIFMLALVSALSRKFQFWPPPSKDSWQHKVFMALFRAYLYPLIVLSALEFEVLEGRFAIIQYAIGGALFLIGFGLAFRITLGMGWRNAFGENRGLKTTGWFAWSRNPIYVVTWVGLIGWALIANVLLVTLLLSAWALLYFLAPFLEEPWLEEQYGDEYTSYKEKTRRFF